MSWVFKRMLSFEHPKHMLKPWDNKIFTILPSEKVIFQNLCLNVYVLSMCRMEFTIKSVNWNVKSKFKVIY